MKASELRIGNLVKNNLTGELLKVCDVLCDGINTINIQGLNYGFIEPIPLTEEWLLKFGFENKNGKFLINIDDRFKVCVAVRIDKWYLYNDDFDSECNIICKVEAVHRLQNLFFDIWNIELIIK